MFKSLKIVRKYYNLARVRPIFIVLEFLTLLIPAIISIYSAVLLANVISALTVYDFSGAIKQLSINFSLIVVSAISYFCYHLLSKKVNHTIAVNLNEFVYSNVRLNKNINKISLSTVSNITTCVDFNKEFLYKLCFFIKSIIIIVIVMYYSLLLGFGLIAVSLIMGLLLSFTDKKIQVSEKEYSNYQANSLVLFNSILKGSKLEENQNLENRLKDKYFALVANGAKIKNKTALFYNLNNNFVSLILKSAVFGFTIYLITLVKSTTLTLSLYLILTPYLTNSAQNLIEFFDMFSKVGKVDTILQEFDALKFQSTLPDKDQEKELDIDTFNLYFYHTTLETEDKKINENKNEINSIKNLKKYNNKSNKNLITSPEPQIFDMNIKIEYGTFVNFVGELGSGKSAIFKLLSREKACTSGSIFLDYKNIAEIKPEIYKSIVAVTNNNPYFYNISVIENLTLVCENRSKINSAIRAFSLGADIEHLKDKINTVIDEKFNSKLLYFLGILRAYISGAKIICIYEIPENFLRADKLKLLHIIKFLKNKCTLIFLSRSDELSTHANHTYYIEKSKIINEK